MQGSTLALNRPQAVTVLQGDMPEAKVVERTAGESMSRLPRGNTPGLQEEAGARGVVQMTAQSHCHHTARWARWGSVIGTATFALWGCSANVRL